jgi:peptidoglycan lytic transglycosylase
MNLSRPHAVALLATLTSLLAGSSAPALAGSTTGGSTAPGQGTSTAGYGVTSPNQTVGASPTTGDGTIVGNGGGIVGTKLKFKGVANGAKDGDNVSLQAQDGDGTWNEIASTKTDEDGAWVARWRADKTGSLIVRAVTGGASGGTGEAADAPDAPTMKVVVYQSTRASVYGVGDDGQIGTRTACGQMLKETTLGVANKTLPCGTKVTFFYGGKTITVPVIDRGPYRKGYSWDLTTETADRLGFEGIGTVGSLVVAKPATSKRR